MLGRLLVVRVLPVLVLLLLLPAPALSASAPVLGSPDHLAPAGSGWGRVEPRRIFNGGDPSGEVGQLAWEHWGAGRAKGYGVTWLLRPGGGYYGRPGRIVLRASGLGACPDGTTAYTHLDFRIAPRPDVPAARRWQPWAGDGDIC